MVRTHEWPADQDVVDIAVSALHKKAGVDVMWSEARILAEIEDVIAPAVANRVVSDVCTVLHTTRDDERPTEDEIRDLVAKAVRDLARATIAKTEV